MEGRLEALPGIAQLCLEAVQFGTKAVSLLMFARPLALLALQFALLEFQVFVGDLDKTLPLLLLDIDDVAGQSVDVLDAERGLQRRFQADFRMVVGCNLLNFLAVEEKELRDARRDRPRG